MKKKLKRIIVTGASGFIGRNFLESGKEYFYIFCIARRSGREADIPFHPNINWIQWDISNSASIADTAHYINSEGGADYIIHLAGYYDFDYDNKPEYQETNVKGTQNVLELGRILGIKHFIFSSSLAVCSFGEDKAVITEESDADALFAYAKSKKEGERLVKEYSQYFRCSIIRLAAIYSDWCEYAPLYKFLSTWFSKVFNSKMLAGKGNSGITYLHIYDLIKLLILIINKSSALKNTDTYLASPAESSTHKQLFKSAMREYQGKPVKPKMMPKELAFIYIYFRMLIWKTGIISKPFERPWMLGYLDKKMIVDASYTMRELGWKPTPRYHIERRMIFLVVNNKSHFGEWQIKNEAALKRKLNRINIKIYESLLLKKEQLTETISNKLIKSEKTKVLSKYRDTDKKEVYSFISSLFCLLMASVRSGDRSFVLKYIYDVALERFALGFEVADMHNALDKINEIVVDDLTGSSEMELTQQEIYDHIEIAIQLARDETEEIFEILSEKIPIDKRSTSISLPYYRKQQNLFLRLSMPYQDYDKEKVVSKREKEKKKEFTLYDIR